MSTDFPGDDQNGLWKDIGPSFEEKDVFAAPFKGKGALGNGGSTVGVEGRASKLTRLEGHGIPVECSSGREGEVLIQGRSSWTFFFGFLRKENMIVEFEWFCDCSAPEDVRCLRQSSRIAWQP